MGLGHGLFPEKDFWPSQKRMLTTFKNEGIVFDEVLIDTTLPQDNAQHASLLQGL